jgi:hypothetical protein
MHQGIGAGTGNIHDSLDVLCIQYQREVFIIGVLFHFAVLLSLSAFVCGLGIIIYEFTRL